MTVAREIPLGRKESQTLEFKAAAALQDHFKIGREVVGMLNAGVAGEVWIGLAEEDHRAVRVEGIPDAEAEARSFRDFLTDSVEPAPVAGEIQIEVESSEDGGEVLRVEVRGKPERQPYALQRRGARDFVVRVGDRLRLMRREEILGTREDGGDSTLKATQKVAEELEQKTQPGESLLWLRVQPVPGGRLNLQHPCLVELLTDPTRTGSQRARRSFADAAVWGGPPKLVQRNDKTVLELGAEEGDAMAFTRIHRDGGLEVEFSLDLAMGPSNRRPLSTAELLASVLRLLRGILTCEGFQEATGNRFLVHLALLGLEGEPLFSSTPTLDSVLPDSRQRSSRDPYPERDFILDQPLNLDRSEILENPDRIAFRLLRELLEAFGYPESEMPAEFDRQTHRLILPE